MKKAYVKPQVAVENIFFDQPIAVNCSISREDMEALEGFGYFMDSSTCSILVDDNNRVDTDGDGDFGDEVQDTICYHSYVQQAWYS